MNKRYLLYGYSHSFHKKNEAYGFSGKTKLLQQWLTFVLQEYPEKLFSSAFPNLFGKDTTMFFVKFTNQNLLTHAKFIKVHLPAEGKL